MTSSSQYDQYINQSEPVDQFKPVYLPADWLEAEQSYKEALVLCPVCFSKERAVLFSNRAAARLHLVTNS